MVADGDRPTVLSVQKYESGPPVAPSPDGQLVSADGDTLAATKQEEWVTKRKVELTTTKQIETRVKRQVVLEDGKVVDDSGPIVTTNTTEDTDKKESEHTEHLTHGDDQEVGEGWVAIEQLPEEAVVKETNERKVTTHDEVEDILETEQVQHLGDVSNQPEKGESILSENLVRAIREGSDTRRAVLTKSDTSSGNNRRELVPLSPQELDALPKRVLNQSRRHDRTTDIEDTKEVSKVKENGNVVTEITRRHEHEEFHNEDIPDSDSDEFEHIENREGNHDYSHAKNEDLIEYVAVPRGGNPSQGVKVADGAHLVSENISSERHGDEDLWDSVSERIRKLPKTDQLFQANNKLNQTPISRSDVLTQRPLDIDQEEYTRKNETNRWLNSHFGSSSSSLNSETSPRSPLHLTPQGIHVTMTSRSSPLNSPPPPPPMPPSSGPQPPYSSRLAKGKSSKSENEPSSGGKRITFSDAPPRSSPLPPKDAQSDLRNRHEDVIRSLNSQLGRVAVTKSGKLWDEEPTPTPPPRSRRRNSPDIRSVHTPDHTAPINQAGIMNHPRKYTTDFPAALMDKNNDIGERKGYERREQSFGYTGPMGRPLTREELESGNIGDSSYVTKHSDYYKTNETNNPAQTILYENGDAEVTQRKTVERRQKTFNYDGPSQKQFQPKYVLGAPTSMMSRLKGIEYTGPIEDPADNSRSQTLPRRRFYFGDDEGSLINKSIERRNETHETRRGKELRFGTDDINVSISNSYNQHNQTVNNETRRGSLNRSLSFTPRSLGREKPSYPSSQPITQENKLHQNYKSNPHLVDSPDLLSPRLITNMSRSTRDVHNVTSANYSTDRIDNHYGTRQETYQNTNNVSRSKRTFLDNVRKNSPDLYDPVLRGSKASSPARSMTPTNSYGSPVRTFGNETRLVSRPQNSPRALGGANSPMSDDYSETYRMSSSTPEQDYNKPRISTDTTSKFSRRTLRGVDGQPAGKVESSETTTRTKSRYKESEVMYPNGRRVGSPANFKTEFQPQLTSGGSVIIPVRDTNNNKNSHYK
ncbi:unnamed protein product [Allacma fusca]|uniref:Uncharacterized protein n=1 Tax=Allacma fusca TaxID=39272 RepID=A0A8J2MF42_9HEXA|nr:unnamed protein product [Allacma fusca]